uniref:Tubulin delta chain n=1 Tax=Saccoglossus kowalevskii TaxID=10224 RepID=A0ABM0M7D8_SACKO|nr:PREDICTED: tubulin delta chain-like [Saccoglossus kowalevskii]
MAEKDRKNTGYVFHTRDRKLRSINVDSEPKVVRSLLQDTKKSWFRDSNIILGKRGRGTNWALGYHGTRHEPECADDSLLNKTLESLRKEIERCESFSGTVLLHSLSGGTGSGLGAHICECIRDEYQLPYMMSVVIAPHLSGESPLQHYNSLLCLAKLQRNTDSVVLFQNDEVLYQLKRMHKKSDSGISFADMNQHIAACIGGVFLPVTSLTPTCGMPIGAEPWEMVRSICPMPSVKFASINHITKSKASWDTLASSLLHTVPRHGIHGDVYSAMSTVCVVRGDSTNTFPRYIRTVEDKIKHVYNCVSWNPFPVDVWISDMNPASFPGTASMTIAANRSNIIEYTEHILERSKEMFDAKAYLHWYWKYGCEQQDFLDAFDTLETVVSNYKDAVR